MKEGDTQDLPHPRPHYEFRVINWGATDRPHCDPHDCGLTMILVVTEQPDHCLVLPELNIKVEIGNGVVVALASAYLDHFVAGVVGQEKRSSLLFISQIGTARKLKVDLPPFA